jgi:uncharacterized protein
VGRKHGIHPNYVRSAIGFQCAATVQIVQPGPRHEGIFFGLLREGNMGGNLTTDAHLAAIAIEYRAELVSMDSDFRRFKGLRWFDPTAD